MAMDSPAISQLIAADVAANSGFFNSHGINLDSCLVTPARMRFENSCKKGEFLDLWLVLEELPGKKNGYLVVFDEANGEFGLAVYGNNNPVFIGYYGSFTETLGGM